MYGLPGQRPGDVEADIAAALAVRPEHISWYELQVVPGTPLAARGAAGVPAADVRAAMYRGIVRALGRAGYAWYEVSTYALPGRRARHNVAYWHARAYLGLGPGAVSTVGRRRWTNTVDVVPHAPTAETSLAQVRVVPNPYVVSNGWEQGQDRQLQFTHLPARATIRIFNVAGELVRTIEHDAGSAIASSIAVWDLMNENRQLVAAGLYFFHLDSPIGSTQGKFIVIQ